MSIEKVRAYFRSNPVQAVLFDLDGTLTDSAPGVFESVIHALRSVGFADEGKLCDEAWLHQFVGPPLDWSLRNLAGLEGETADRALELFREHYTGGAVFHSRLFPGMKELMEELKAAGVRLGIATGKPVDQAMQVVEHFGLKNLVEHVQSSPLSRNEASKQEIISAALAAMDIQDPGLAVMVGDRCFDMEGARACGVWPVGVDSGYAAPGELEKAGAWAIARNAGELKPVLFACCGIEE